MRTAPLAIPTLDDLAVRTKNAQKIQSAVDQAYEIIQKGHSVKLEGSRFDVFTRYVETFDALEGHVDTTAALIKQKIQKGQKVDPEILKAHQKLEKLVKLIKDKVSFVRTAITSQPAIATQPVSRPEAPKLRKGETPLHWAVRNHNHGLAFQLRIMGHSPIIPDSQGLSPIDEAVLQDDQKMMQILLYADILSDPQKQAVFLSQLDNAQKNLTALKQIDPNTLSPVCRAAYEGNVDELETANGLDQPDEKGLTPLHYALLGGDPKAVYYLASRYSSFNYLTPKARPTDFGGHSYLDYAIASGNLAFFEAFQSFGVPFKLDTQDQQFAFLIASGLLQQQIARDAHKKDPIALGRADMTLGVLNVINLVLQGIGFATQPAVANVPDPAAGAGAAVPDPAASAANSPGWIHSFATGGKKITGQFNDHVGFALLQQQSLLPKIAGQALHTFLGGIQLWTFGNFISEKLGIISPETAKNYAWVGASKVIDSYLGDNASSFLWRAFACYKVFGVAKSVFPKIGSYWNAYASRPSAVLKRSALDVFNLASQSFFAYQAFA